MLNPRCSPPRARMSLPRIFKSSAKSSNRSGSSKNPRSPSSPNFYGASTGSRFFMMPQAREFMRLQKAILRRENKARRMVTQLQEKQEKLDPANAELRDEKIL